MSTNAFDDQDIDLEAVDASRLDQGDDIDISLSSDSDLGYIDDLEHSDDDRDAESNIDNSPLISSDDDDMDGMNKDDDLEDFHFRDALRTAGNFKSKNKKKYASKSYWKRKMMRNTDRELNPEVRFNLSRANEAFVKNDFQSALKLYEEVIKQDPKNFSAYKTLGEIYKQQGDLDKCCNLWILAAYIQPYDTQFWCNIAELSTQLGHLDQAIHCYGRALQSDSSKNSNIILQRALLYKERRQYGRALEGFQRLHQKYPTDSNVVKHLASVYVEQKRINDAINLYITILDKNIYPPSNSKDQYPVFGWAELNILCELYMQQHSYKSCRDGIKTIKIVSRWIQNRTDESWWDKIDDDSEFDKRRFLILKTLSASQQARAKEKFYDLPIDIRFKLGCFRLGVDQKDESLRHFDYLLEETDDISDLLFEAGKSLEAHGYYEEALTFLTRASVSDEQNGPELISLLGKCFLEVGDYQQAQEAYKSLLVSDYENLDAKLALAEAYYHLGNRQESINLLEDVSRTRKATEPNEDEAKDDTMTEESQEDKVSLIKDKQIIKSNKSQKPTEEERLEIEENAKRKVLEKLRRMERLGDAIQQKERVAIKAWMQLASQLIEMFMSVRSFFPRDKNRAFKGIVLYRRKKSMGIDEKLARIYNLCDGISNDENYPRSYLTSTNEYRGLSYDKWFMIFVQYALFLCRYDNIDYAVQIIEVAKEVSVFIQDKYKETFLNMIRLVFGIIRDENSGVVMSQVRYFLSNNQFSPFIYKFFAFCFASGCESWETFANYNHQKFFLRQLKAFDSITSHKKITGMATITADVSNLHLRHEHPELLYIYANLLGGSRSYVSSIVYLNRAYKEYNQDPMICFVLGLAHVHRSMQRLSNNRHIQLLQGVSYILEYRNLRRKNATSSELQEVEYNLGRLFHMIGLTSAACYHYNNVLTYHEELRDTSYDLSMESAYNLALIYNISGNTLLARDITEKYLTV
ncbi:Piso0_003723 [Millerozyma farinosa CBS 7064]|uniref:Piso0_003723 protein n=1 Tax=Pichia sorbitophila (strain ATCC MYA-4447 / BCRC 22081 / CBS 7064 / NBRC 10061 / NRRL Y-12695) TaxID=559304 RepID=G8YAU7_PICSO|nr:Piso0_003723 [Millerozyma farinosa CBS 7064]CCE84182.1 Piso0_003723 [Millerozyma farinosa CBS 7064]